MRREPFMYYGKCKRTQTTVGELKLMLDDYCDDAVVYIEAENRAFPGRTLRAQKILDSYCCVANGKDALMLVGSLR